MIDAATAASPAPSRADLSALRSAAQGLETAFLAEMLKPMGAEAARTEFGGGPGEAQFASFLLSEQARLMVRAGGIGLAESIFRSLVAAHGPGEPDAGAS